MQRVCMCVCVCVGGGGGEGGGGGGGGGTLPPPLFYCLCVTTEVSTGTPQSDCSFGIPTLPSAILQGPCMEAHH